MSDDPAAIGTLIERANALRAARRPIEAADVLRDALARSPGHAAADYTLAVLLTDLGALDEAEGRLRGLHARHPGVPEVEQALALALLAQGRDAEAWPLLASRGQTAGARADGFPTEFPFPRWDGTPLAGRRLAILPEQGLGDQIMFARYLPWVLGQGGAVTALMLPPLERLFAHSFPRLATVLASGQVELPNPDCWTTLYELPRLAPAGAGVAPPYLTTPVAWGAPPAGPRIGLMTAGNPGYRNDAWRSLDGAEAARLRAALPGHVIDLAPDRTGARDLADTAAIVAALNLVVSVDTAVAHLAGAMGRPCFLLVPGFAPDWRWQRGRADSPWYPGHRLYRGGVDGDWSQAIAALAADARAFALP